MGKTLSCLMISTLLSLGMVFLGTEGRGEGIPMVGGPCEYHRYEGRAEITSLRKMIDSKNEAFGRYEATFRFIPHQAVGEPFVQIEGREFLLELDGSSYLRPEIIDKYGLSVGNIFDCILKAIVRGTCTPILFEFPSLSSKEDGKGGS